MRNMVEYQLNNIDFYHMFASPYTTWYMNFKKKKKDLG